MSAGESPAERCVAETSVRSAEGLHMRPATLLAQAAARFDATVRIGRPDGPSADVASMLEVMSLAIGQGEPVRVETEGPDAESALAAVVALFESDFPVEADG